MEKESLCWSLEEGGTRQDGMEEQTSINRSSIAQSDVTGNKDPNDTGVLRNNQRSGQSQIDMESEETVMSNNTLEQPSNTGMRGLTENEVKFSNDENTTTTTTSDGVADKSQVELESERRSSRVIKPPDRLQYYRLGECLALTNSLAKSLATSQVVRPTYNESCVNDRQYKVMMVESASPPTCMTWPVWGDDLRWLLIDSNAEADLYERCNSSVTDAEIVIISNVTRVCKPKSVGYQLRHWEEEENRRELMGLTPWLTNPFLRVLYSWFGRVVLNEVWGDARSLIVDLNILLTTLLDAETQGEMKLKREARSLPVRRGVERLGEPRRKLPPKETLYWANQILGKEDQFAV